MLNGTLVYKLEELSKQHARPATNSTNLTSRHEKGDGWARQSYEGGPRQTRWLKSTAECRQCRLGLSRCTSIWKRSTGKKSTTAGGSGGAAVWAWHTAHTGHTARKRSVRC